LPRDLAYQGAGLAITRYDDVALVLKDERFVKAAANALTPEQAGRQRWFRRMFKAMRRNMLNLDPPDHTRLRALVHLAFTPKLVEQMRGRIQALTHELLDRAQGGGRMDLIRAYALPLPTTIIAEMLGVPAEDHHKFHRWSNALVSAAPSTSGLLKAIPNALAIMRYIRKIIKKRRANPQDDLVSALAQANQAGDTLSEEELSAMIMLLLVAGHETTVNLIGNGTLALLEHPLNIRSRWTSCGIARHSSKRLWRSYSATPAR
jgi:cytochrome P450